MTESHTAAARAKWQKYFEKVIDGSVAEVEAATEGAMRAIERRADQIGVIAAGHEAAAAYRSRKQAANDAGGRPVSPAPPAAPVLAGGKPITRAVGDARSGVVTGLQQRQEPGPGRSYYQVWTFRLERRTAEGAVVQPVPVELRSRSIQGQIANGDLVELPKKTRPKSVRNLTTGALVKTKGRPHPVLYRLMMTVVALCFLTFVAFFAYSWFHPPS